MFNDLLPENDSAFYSTECSADLSALNQ